MKNILSVLTTGVSGLVVVGCLQGCVATEAEKQAMEDAFAVDPAVLIDGSLPSETRAGIPVCVDQRSVQNDAVINRSIDILFVTDTSSSLDAERQAIADGIDSFVKELPSAVDYRIGVMMGHSSKSSYAGKLYAAKNSAAVLDSQSMSLASIRTQLKNTLMNTKEDSYADGGEEMLYSLNRSLQSDRVAEIQAQGFYRKDAALAVIFITDENDVCYPGKVVDNEGRETSGYKRDCTGINADSVLKKVKAFSGSRPLLMSGIAYTDSKTVPKGGENEIGLGIIDIVKLQGGLMIDMAKGHFDEGLRQAGELTSLKLTLRTNFILDGVSDLDASSVKVKVDGVDVAHIFQAPNIAIVPEALAGKLNSVVEVHYCEKVTMPPGGTDDGSNPGSGGNPGGPGNSGPSPTPTPSQPPVCTGFGCEGGGVGI